MLHVWTFSSTVNGRRLNYATEFVPSEDPDLNVSEMEAGDCFWDSFLKFVLDCCGAEKLRAERQSEEVEATKTKHQFYL